MNSKSKYSRFLYIGIGIIAVVYLTNKWLHSLPKPVNEDLLPKTNALDKSKILKKGSVGLEVTELQRILVKDYNANLGTSGLNKDGIDGDFGSLTLIALMNAKGVSEITLDEL